MARKKVIMKKLGDYFSPTKGQATLENVRNVLKDYISSNQHDQADFTMASDPELLLAERPSAISQIERPSANISSINEK